MGGVTDPVTVYLEVGSKRLFAGGVEWPGWCRSSRSEADALDALLRYGPRYAEVAALAGIRFAPPPIASAFSVTERLQGNATTDFGAPGVPPAVDERPLSAAELERLTALLRAAWQTLDTIAEQAAGLTLRTGPRGGGRDLDKMVAHVREAEAMYLTKLGSRTPAGVAAAREAVVAALAARVANRPIPNPSGSARLWTPRYYVRRAAWHVLDHAWEIEDRALG